MAYGPVIFWSDDSPDGLADAKAYIARFGLTREDVALVIKDRQTMVITRRNCSAKLIIQP